MLLFCFDPRRVSMAHLPVPLFIFVAEFSRGPAVVGALQLHHAVLLGQWYCMPTLVALLVPSFMAFFDASVLGLASSSTVFLSTVYLVVISLVILLLWGRGVLGLLVHNTGT